MAQALEKIFLQRVAEMPQEETEISAITTKTPVKGGRKSSAGKLHSLSSGLILHKHCMRPKWVAPYSLYSDYFQPGP